MTRPGKTHFVQENYESVLAVPYDYPIVGYNNHVVNTLRIWDAEPIVDFQLESFDRGDYHKAVEQQNPGQEYRRGAVPQRQSLRRKRAAPETAVFLRVCQPSGCSRKV